MHCKHSVDGPLQSLVDAPLASPRQPEEEAMDNKLVTELRSITAAALSAMSAAERADWDEAEKCVADLG